MMSMGSRQVALPALLDSAIGTLMALILRHDKGKYNHPSIDLGAIK